MSRYLCTILTFLLIQGPLALATDHVTDQSVTESDSEDVTTEALPDLISPDELSIEMGLPRAKTLMFDGYFETMTIDDWSSLNGLDITQFFKVVVLINKSDRGPSAQTAKVFFEGKPYGTYKVSTGRENLEVAPSGKVYRSSTPQGWFRPTYFSPNHFSRTWNAPMPWAVFFNGGIAMHATTRSHYDELGRRASGGCVRFRHEHAKELYHLIKGAGKAQVPKFSQSGTLRRNDVGNLIMEENYDTLIIVESSRE
jgi:hypothetical protein